MLQYFNYFTMRSLHSTVVRVPGPRKEASCPGSLLAPEMDLCSGTLMNGFMDIFVDFYVDLNGLCFMG